MMNSIFVLVLLLLLGCLSAALSSEEQSLSEDRAKRNFLREGGVPVEFLPSLRFLEQAQMLDIGPCLTEDEECCYYSQEELDNGCNQTAGFMPRECTKWMDCNAPCSKEVNGTIYGGNAFKCEVPYVAKPLSVYFWIGLVVGFIIFVICTHFYMKTGAPC
ncbi:hypothetical protein TrRE_jg6828 [Triparma retinervis]|uniref:Uncharacterized protein n=1 Tax=Triparma retinervis TaxID=2557542 RepID=A0A9W6Z9Y2_9STRA|nr:hypothetical protein TrRE_jg6828 [Triparma retinervis]